MKYFHVNPDEAVQIHKDIKSRKSFGIHWGTFKMVSTIVPACVASH
jgi:N-acyl-phosphatidylethanolamine-hydrolysing phospholipase D